MTIPHIPRPGFSALAIDMGQVNAMSEHCRENIT